MPLLAGLGGSGRASDLAASSHITKPKSQDLSFPSFLLLYQGGGRGDSFLAIAVHPKDGLAVFPASPSLGFHGPQL